MSTWTPNFPGSAPGAGRQGCLTTSNSQPSFHSRHLLVRVQFLDDKIKRDRVYHRELAVSGIGDLGLDTLPQKQEAGGPPMMNESPISGLEVRERPAMDETLDREIS